MNITFKHLIITVDYELFGNGTGDLFNHIITPAERIMSIGDEFKLPITFFVEVEEYLQFKKHSDYFLSKKGHDPAQVIEEQIRSMISRGHDVQLHIHPEWVGAELSDGVWRLNQKNTSIDALFFSQEETTEYIRSRKQVLEEIIGRVQSGRKITAYRAGAFCAQPGQKLITALVQNGITIDSSVVKGLHRQGTIRDIDYRKAPAGKQYWRIKNDVACEDPSGTVFEIPIFSKMGRRLNQISLERYKAKFSKNVPLDKKQEMISQLGIKKDPVSLFKFLFSKIPVKLDFHNLSARKTMSLIDAYAPDRADLPNPVVCIGHTKEHNDDRGLRTFINLSANRADVKIVSFNQVSEMLLKCVLT